MKLRGKTVFTNLLLPLIASCSTAPIDIPTGAEGVVCSYVSTLTTTVVTVVVHGADGTVTVGPECVVQVER